VALRDRLNPAAHAVFVDVGVDEPTNLAIRGVELPRQVVPANDRVLFHAQVLATGRDYDTEIRCRIDNDPRPDVKPLKIKAGQAETVTFERRAQDLKLGLHRAEITLAAPDNLPFSAGRFATFEIRGPRRVLTITDRPGAAGTDAEDVIWKLMLNAGGAFQCEIMSTQDATGLGPKELAKYQAVCLLNVASPSADLWEKLYKYVEQGGGLAVLPGDNLRAWAYSEEKADAWVNKLLPCAFEEKPIDDERGALLDDAQYREPLRGWFQAWKQQPNLAFARLPPRAMRYWAAKSYLDKNVMARYADKEGRPAILERLFDDRKLVRGHVVVFTTSLCGARLGADTDRTWNNYLTKDVGFAFALAHKLIGYLAGDADAPSFNYVCGQAVTIALPAALSDVHAAGAGTQRVGGSDLARHLAGRAAAHAGGAARTVHAGGQRRQMADRLQHECAGRRVRPEPRAERRSRSGAGPGNRPGARPRQRAQGSAAGTLEPAGGTVPVADDSVTHSAGGGEPVGESVLPSSEFRVPSSEFRTPGERPWQQSNGLKMLRRGRERGSLRREFTR
jgi:hypothetical protein